MGTFITEQNIARFRLQLLTPKNEEHRKMLVRLLAEEETRGRQAPEQK